MKILLLDAYNLIYRAKSGFTKGDYPVIYNFFRGIRPLVERFDPDKVYFVLEGNPKFRNSISSGDYKSNRPAQSRVFHEQKANIISLVKNCLPFTSIKHPELECDDTIATLTSIHMKKGDDVTIVSSDTDFIQLLNIFKENFRIYNPVKKKFIECPDYDYVVWKALRGDNTDNITGIRGIGDKTAEKICRSSSLLKETLEDREKREIFERNVNLIRLVDFSDNISQAEIVVGTKDFDKLKNAFESMGFDSMIKEKSWDKYCNTFKKLQGENNVVSF